MELLKYLNSFHNSVGPGRLDGHALRLCKGRIDDANWYVLYFHVFIVSLGCQVFILHCIALTVKNEDLTPPFSHSIYSAL